NLTDNSTTKLSRSRLNNDTDGPSTAPRISGDGEKVVFLSSATNIVADDKNDLQDAFLLNLTDNSMIRVSENSTGDVDGISQEVLINSTGTYVVFQSSATDLIRNDTNKTSDIFAYTVSSSALSRISVTPLGDELTGASSSPSINSDGHFITFISSDSDLVDLDRNELSDLFLINTQCLLEPEGVTPNDTDGDSTNDCEDGCPVDNTKITPGECGCGTSDEDTDGDETPDCLDSCAEDSSKIAPGGCGCGVPDTDENANGIADCLDPTTSTRPRKPSAVYRKRKNSVRISIPEGYPGYSYQVEIRSTSNVRKRFRTRSQKSLVSANGLSGQLRARYRIILPNGFSQFSRLAKVQKR
ncbi:MAG: hypothetical protein KDD60_12675, partial [Bdellovibrionales bacterium]|nr:hypothetical protein [Bdellovibrionales bacterium]